MVLDYMVYVIVVCSTLFLMGDMMLIKSNYTSKFSVYVVDASIFS